MLDQESKVKWEQFIRGDKSAYAWIYKTYIRELYHYGLRFSNSPELVKDCIQELFTALYKNRTKLPVPDKVKVYLFVALKHNLVHALNKEAAYDSGDDMEEYLHFSLEPTVEDRYIEKEEYHLQQEKISKTLKMLTPRQQEIIYYRFIQELSYEEICSLMDINYQSAQNLIHRSLKKLKENYGNVLFFISVISYQLRP